MFNAQFSMGAPPGGIFTGYYYAFTAFLPGTAFSGL
jgi:hypothetical protein